MSPQPHRRTHFIFGIQIDKEKFKRDLENTSSHVSFFPVFVQFFSLHTFNTVIYQQLIKVEDSNMQMKWQ